MAGVISLRSISVSDNFLDEMDKLIGNYCQSIQGEKSAGTVRCYAQDIQSFFRWYAARYPQTAALELVAPGDIAEWRDTLVAGGKKPATVKRALAAVKVFFAWLVERGELQLSPANKVKPLTEAAVPAPNWLGRSEKWRLTRALEEHGSERDRAACALMLWCGLRVAELAALKVEDVELRERSGWVTVRQGKGGKFRRVPIPLKAREWLRPWVMGQTGRWLFPGENTGSAVDVRTVRRWVEKWRWWARLERLFPHMLRHTYCHDVLVGGQDLATVARLAGHSTVEVTRRYVEPSADELAAAVEGLE